MREPRDIPTADALDAPDALVARHLDGQLDADAFAALGARLAADPDAIDELLAASALHAALGEQIEHRAVDAVIASARSDHAARTARSRVRTAVALAAGLLIAAGVWFAKPADPPAPAPLGPPLVETPTSPNAPVRPRAVDLTRAVFAAAVAADESLVDEPVVTPEPPFLAVLLTTPGDLPPNWPILGGTLESSPTRPASVSPVDDLNPRLRFTP